MPYATLDDLKYYLLNATTPDDTGDLLQGALDDAKRYIENKTRRLFEVSQDSTRYFDGEADVSADRLVLWLDHDLCAITAITNGDGTSISSSQYVKNPRNRTPWYSLQLKLSSDLAWTYNDSPESAIAITGRWGYSTSAPDDIHRAHLLIAAWYYRQKDTRTPVDQPLMTADGVMIYPTSIPKAAMEILSNYQTLTPGGD